MRLDQLLGGMSVEQLQELALVWAPEERMSRSKSEMFRVLRTRMVEPERVRRSLEQAGVLGRGMVRRVLRSEGRSESVAALAASSAGRPRSIQEVRVAAGELAAMGLACVEAEKRWETYGSARVGIPDELVGPLRAATGIDGRSWREVLSLAGYLEALGRDAAARELRRLRVKWSESEPLDAVLRELCEAGSCSERVAGLSPKLRQIVMRALAGHAGLVSLDRPPEDIGVEVGRVKKSTVEGWRAELERNLIGTVGDVSLLEYGIDLDGRVLSVFGEVTEALAGAGDVRGVADADEVGPDFVLDLLELVSVVRESGARLKGSGELAASAVQRIAARMNRPALAGMGSGELMELRLACAEKLGLVERGPDSLVAAGPARKWERKGYEEKAGDLFALMGSVLPAPRSKHHHDGLCEAARGVLRGMEPGAWRRGGMLEQVTLRRYLARLDESGLRERISSAVSTVAQYVLPPFPTLGQLQADVREAVVLEAYAMGLMDVAMEGDKAAGERLSAFGAVAVGRGGGHAGRGALLVMPDFEVIILPEGDSTRLRYEAGQFAVRQKFERTYHLRITKERVEEAVVRGLSADEMVRLLREHSTAGAVPQNVEASIRGWAARVRVAAVEQVFLLEVADERLLDVVAELPGVKERVLRRVSGTALALSEWPGEREVLAELRRLGVFVR